MDNKFERFINNYKENIVINNERYEQDKKILSNIKSYVNFFKKDDNENIHSNIDYVYFISTLINSFYSTRMGADRVYQTAKYINKKAGNFEELIRYGKSENMFFITAKINKNIDKIREDEREFSSYSFLTKYITIHNQFIKYDGEDNSDFTIYDSKVREVIYKLGLNKLEKEPLNLNGERDFGYSKRIKNIDIYNYNHFYKLMAKILEKLRENYKDKNINFRKLDFYFWNYRDL